MGLVCARRTRPISGSASDYEGLSGDGSAGGPQEDFAGRARYDLANYGILAALRRASNQSAAADVRPAD